ncbi:hypothetical protein ORV05_27350 [Amycolatopsis cynarae]|uniref:Uncharacterized protein n=1 Tax=Amycolatopsis cynarae TaxID=2995223 RepID=A0ABY7B051_9PSEU|nr:hypothetical protein [Amycolatopsis sp. HUAS 11-8]WAL64648.1 hypothetical protein ORV05_27350 [Amycolatopsis sp. HUAS 11-8]
MDGFDLKQVTKLEWMGIGGGLVAFVASFLPWYSFSAGVLSGSLSAWSVGIGGWGPVLLLIACGALVLAPRFGRQVPNAPLIWLIASGVSVLIILLRWVTLPSDPLGGLGGAGFSAGAGFGLFLGLVAAIVSCAGAVPGYLATRKAA